MEVKPGVEEAVAERPLVPGLVVTSRVAPRCRHAAVCGGCTWQHVAYAEQRALKTAAVQQWLDDALGPHAPRVRPTWSPRGEEGADAATPWGFRHKVHFVCGDAPPGRGSRPGLAVGHYAEGGRSVVPVVECPVHAEAGNRVAFAVREACERLGIPAAGPDGRGGLLRHVVIRVARTTGERLLTLVVTSGRDPRVQRLVEAIAGGPEAPDGIHVNVLEGPSRWLFGLDTRKVHGRAWLREEIAGVSFLVGPTTFFQTNLDAAETLVRLVLAAVPSTAADVLDLYAGVGLFALPLARRGHRVVAIEEHAGAVDAGRASLRLSGLDERACRFIRARVEDGLTRLRGHRRDPSGTAVILDPPRAGSSRRVLRAVVGEVVADTIVYVSCDPRALATDLAASLEEARRARVTYRVESVQPVDMFPHTPHVEAVAVLRRVAERVHGRT